MAKEPQEQQLFPIPNQVYLDALIEFGRYTDDELAMIEAANEAVPPENNASLFALRMNMHPALSAQNTEMSALQKHAYRTGVLIGRRIIKSLIEVDDDEDFVVMSDEQREEVLRSVQRSRRGEFIPPQEQNLMALFDRHLSARNPEHGFYPYLQPEGELLYGFLRSAWERSEVPFYHDEQAKQRAGDLVPRGMRDLFRLFAYLEDSEPRNWSIKEREEDGAISQDREALEDSPLAEYIKFLRGEDNDLSNKEQVEMIGFIAWEQVQHEQIQRMEQISARIGRCMLPTAMSVPPLMMGGSLLAHGSDILHVGALTAATAVGSVGGGLAIKKVMNRLKWFS